MPWFKVDDSFHSHSKVWATSPAALGLWVVAGAWSSSNLTDGFVPDHAVPRLLPDADKLATELVAAGLWKRTKGGYRFHDWHDYNPTADEVNAERAAARQRMRELRAKRKANHGFPVHDANGSGEQQANVRRSSQDVPNPDPTRPELPDGSSSRPRKRGTRIPDDFTVTPDMVAWARERVPHVDGRLETEKFINHWTGKSGKDATKVDWVATWRNWMLNAVHHYPGKSVAVRKATTDQRMDQADAALADVLAEAERRSA